jgi:hypothetical protein
MAWSKHGFRPIRARVIYMLFYKYISCFYIYLVKYFNLNEKFILLKNSSDRIGILYQNSDSD